MPRRRTPDAWAMSSPICFTVQGRTVSRWQRHNRAGASENSQSGVILLSIAVKLYCSLARIQMPWRRRPSSAQQPRPGDGTQAWRHTEHGKVRLEKTLPESLVVRTASFDGVGET